MCFHLRDSDVIGEALTLLSLINLPTSPFKLEIKAKKCINIFFYYNIFIDPDPDTQPYKNVCMDRSERNGHGSGWRLTGPGSATLVECLYGQEGRARERRGGKE